MQSPQSPPLNFMIWCSHPLWTSYFDAVTPSELHNLMKSPPLNFTTLKIKMGCRHLLGMCSSTITRWQDTWFPYRWVCQPKQKYCGTYLANALLENAPDAEVRPGKHWHRQVGPAQHTHQSVINMTHNTHISQSLTWPTAHTSTSHHLDPQHTHQSVIILTHNILINQSLSWPITHASISH